MLFHHQNRAIPEVETTPLPAPDAEKDRTWNGDIRQEGALLLELATKREAAGRRDRAIDAIADVVFVLVQDNLSNLEYSCLVMGPPPSKTRESGQIGMDENEQYRR